MRSVQTVPGKSEVTVEVITHVQLDVRFEGESELTCIKQNDLGNYTLLEKRSSVLLAAVCDGLDLDNWSLFSKEREAIKHENKVLKAWSVHFVNKDAVRRAKRTGNEVTKKECFREHLQSLKKLRRAVRALKEWLNKKMLDFNH